MLIPYSNLINTPVLSLQTGGPIGRIEEPVIDPDSLKIVAFRLSGPLISKSAEDLLDIKSIREYSDYGMVIDSTEELFASDDVVKISKIISLNFKLIDLKVETKKHSKLGKVSSFTLDPDSFIIQQIIVKRPTLKSFLDPELTISRKEIVEITDDKIIVKDEEKVLKKRAEKEDFIPNFVNPFRGQNLAQIETDKEEKETN